MARRDTVAMARGRRRRAMAVAAAATVPLIALPVGGISAPIAAAEFNYFPTEPTRVLTLSLLPGGNDDDLSGVMCESPRTCKNVTYSYVSTTDAAANLNIELRDGTAGKQIVFAYSQGARVAAAWLRENGGTAGAPTADDLSFVLMGNPGRKYGGSDRDADHKFPETDYHVIDVSQQYDMASDFPDDPFNVLALLNASAGLVFTHMNYETVDIYDEANYVWTEGNTTYVFVPTENLPLLQPLRLVGLGFLADALNAPLKEIVERAYDRSYLPAQPGLPTSPEPETEEPQADTGTTEATPVQSASARTETPRGKTSHLGEDLAEDLDVDEAPVDTDVDADEPLEDDSEPLEDVSDAVDDDDAESDTDTDTEKADSGEDDSSSAGTERDRPTRDGDTGGKPQRDASDNDGGSGGDE